MAPWLPFRTSVIGFMLFQALLMTEPAFCWSLATVCSEGCAYRACALPCCCAALALLLPCCCPALALLLPHCCLALALPLPWLCKLMAKGHTTPVGSLTVTISLLLSAHSDPAPPDMPLISCLDSPAMRFLPSAPCLYYHALRILPQTLPHVSALNALPLGVLIDSTPVCCFSDFLIGCR